MNPDKAQDLGGGRIGWVKDPDSTLDYIYDWSLWLAEVNDIIDDHEIVQPSNSTIHLDSSIEGEGQTIVTVWLTGIAPGVTEGVTVRIFTAGGRTDDRTLWYRGRQR